MKKHILLLSVALLLILIGVFMGAGVSAQDDEPLDEDYNWCTDPTYWGDGRCDDFENDDLIWCHWQLGWYLPRVQAGMFAWDDVVEIERCLTLLPEVVTEATPETTPPPQTTPPPFGD